MSRRRFDAVEGNSDSQQSNKFDDSRIFFFFFELEAFGMYLPPLGTFLLPVWT